MLFNYLQHQTNVVLIQWAHRCLSLAMQAAEAPGLIASRASAGLALHQAQGQAEVEAEPSYDYCIAGDLVASKGLRMVDAGSVEASMRKLMS